MKNVMNNVKDYSVYLGILFMSLSLTSCSDDDDGVIEDRFTGSITAEDQTISDNTIIVESVTVGQDSWLVAVRSEEENSDNSDDFIAGPELIAETGESDINLTLNNNANLESGADGNEIVLKLYADDEDGIWDEDDEAITDASGVLASETITVTIEEGTAGDFSSFDENADGNLDENEFGNTYENDLSEWDADEDGSLNDEEFYNTTFGNTDADDDDAINEDEWNAGYTGMYGDYVGEGDFTTFDADDDGMLNNDEWNQGFGETEWYGTYDSNADDTVSETEWDQGLFRDWDTNDDDLIDEDEYNAYGGYAANW